MFILIVLLSMWALLMWRSAIAEYKYYQAVKTLEPDVWEKLGAPKYLKIPLVFVSSKGTTLLAGISNESVCILASKHRQAGMHFLSYVIMLLIVSIVYFKVA
jgi:hypothetical protein